MSFLRRSKSLPIRIPTGLQFETDPELERRRQLARDALVKAHKNVDSEKRLRLLWLVK
jgi:hypothetical protein